MHELLCYVRLADARGLSGSTRTELVRRLTPHVLRMAATEPERLIATTACARWTWRRRRSRRSPTR